ncbi:MAG: 16S rRNA (cytidine(1402)-2'-O)-methyltransferase [Rhodospirillales bacterium]|nr:16S rRNA (cytidine(1402)-2'-O)-methyltransferase [Rhodospirillales bacterium]
MVASGTSGGLYIVATPIGNAQDITLRGLDILAQADVIACEDTRVTAKLLAIHGISRPLTPYHEHNASKAGPKLIKRLKDGEIVALVSDAGTPLVSDPGYKLICACLEEALAVIPLPGASSVLAALVVSGLPTDRFFFAGFLPPKSAARKRVLNEFTEIPGSLVFLESAKRLAASLADMAGVLGPRSTAVSREITKMFEETRRGSLDELAAHYRGAGPPKGEVTIVVGPFTEEPVSDAELDRLLVRALKGSTVRDAADAVTAATGLPRRRVYTRALEIKKSPE